MLEITLPKEEIWLEKKEEFMMFPEVKMKLEHSLISIWKWESKIKKPFLSTKMNASELTYYIWCMSINPIELRQAARVLKYPAIKEQIEKYMSDPMTATTFNQKNIDMLKNNGGAKQVITAEVIYYWMSELNLPFDVCEKWHINRLLSLVQVCNIKKTPPKKMNKSDVYKQNKSLNAARKAARGTNG